MEIPELPYTLPRIVKTKSSHNLYAGPQSISRWYVEFFYFDAKTEKMERFRFTKNLNRLHDLKEKQKHFNNLREAYKIALENGWSPVDQNANIKLKKEVIGINLKQGLVKFEEYHNSKGTRPKTISTYRSKVEAFIKYHGAETKVSTITDFEVTDFLNFKEREDKWVGVTYVNSRICLNNYFRYLLSNKYIKVNPVTGTESRKRMATQSNQVFSEKDFTIISKWLQDNDPYCLFFVKMIYFTCIRPKELRFLRLSHIDMEEYTITVPGTVAKNRKSIPINIDIKLRDELHQMNLSNYPNSYFLLGSAKTFISETPCSENFAYNRFQKCLEANGLTDKNYTLYSFKHLSNVRKFRAGWSLSDICAANRHGSISETDTYLKELLKHVVTDREVPDF